MTSQSNMTQEQTSTRQNTTMGFGEQLRRAREAQGISVGDMSAQMHISVDLWRALEEENAERFHEPVYVRGHIRTACRILKIDPQPLLNDYVARFNGDVLKVNQLTAPHAFKEVDYVVNPAPSRWKLILLVLLVLLAGLGIWGVYSGNVAQWLASENSEAKKVDQKISETVTPPIMIQTERLKDPLPPVLPPRLSVASTDQAQKILKDQSRQEIAQNIKSVEAVKERPTIIESPKVYKMAFHATGPCWVQVIDPKGKSLFAREMQAGRHRRLEVPLGTKITVGNTPAMLVRLDGHPYDITSAVRRGVARFVVR